VFRLDSRCRGRGSVDADRDLSRAEHAASSQVTGERHGFPSDYFRFTRGAIGELSSFAGLDVVEAWPIGGPWATLFHWYWANHSRESSLRRVPVVGVGYHAYFQALSAIADRLDAESDHGARGRAQEHVDHVGWSFVSRKPG
jgi:hypothetical protein